MENNKGSVEYESLGSLFRRLRMERSLDISDVSEETRIPAKTIRAIEMDEYDKLPAPAFARGFYSLYAKMLDLDENEIIARYYNERSSSAGKLTSKMPSPSWQHTNIGTMAERPSLTLGSLIGSALLVTLLLIAGIFWYVGYNPATHISQWIRSFQDDPVYTEQQTAEVEDTEPTVLESEPELDEQRQVEETLANQSGVTVVRASKYQLAAEFPFDTQLTISVDGGEARDILISADTIETWYAENSIVLELLPETKAEMYLNGELLTLPPAENDKITISIPE